jgi:hypothetical protein
MATVKSHPATTKRKWPASLQAIDKHGGGDVIEMS